MLHACAVLHAGKAEVQHEVQHKVQLDLTEKDSQFSLEDASDDAELVSILPCCLEICLAGH